MSVLVEIDGSPTELYPIYDEFGVITFDGDAELYSTADGRRVRVLCTPGGFAADSARTQQSGAATSSCGDATPRTTEAAAVDAAAMPTRQHDSEEALWSGRRTKFLIENYKEHFGRIGQKGGLRTKKQLMLFLTDSINDEFGCCLTVVQVTNKWKSLERAYKRVRTNNNKSGSAAAECSFEGDLQDFMERQHHVSPVVTYAQGQKIVPDDRERELQAPEAVDSPTGHAELPKQKKDRPLLQLLQKLDEIEKNRATRHKEKMALLERFVSAYETKK
ncbi:uncharacterized protein [Dermacentor andersoni]|uniref:uncharacterized protein isoform X2 n=1 Tax=Dermacentor andersoni TaxID=34620 RepID=UPI0024160DCE|nr:uncharacterized protein LOC126547680 isoform X2 [Dermacentor andersoni]